jgi:hypothetical protein
MGMMEIVVGAIAGSVAGTIVGVPMLFIQNRVNRRTYEDKAIFDASFEASRAAMKEAWEAAHEAERLITSDTTNGALTAPTLRDLHAIGGRLAQHGMLCRDADSRVRVEDCGHTLQRLTTDLKAGPEQTRMILAVIQDAQLVSAAFLLHQPIPVRAPALQEDLRRSNAYP